MRDDEIRRIDNAIRELETIRARLAGKDGPERFKPDPDWKQRGLPWGQANCEKIYFELDEDDPTTMHVIEAWGTPLVGKPKMIKVALPFSSLPVGVREARNKMIALARETQCFARDRLYLETERWIIDEP